MRLILALVAVIAATFLYAAYGPIVAAPLKAQDRVPESCVITRSALIMNVNRERAKRTTDTRFIVPYDVYEALLAIQFLQALPALKKVAVGRPSVVIIWLDPSGSFFITAMHRAGNCEYIMSYGRLPATAVLPYLYDRNRGEDA